MSTICIIKHLSTIPSHFCVNKIGFNNNNNNNIIRDMKLILTTCLPIYSVPFPDVIKLNERV